MGKKYYLGLSVTYHDPALAIVDGEGTVLFAQATERHLQYKRAVNCEPDSLNHIAALLREYCADAEEIAVAFNWLKRRPYYEILSPLLGYFSAPGLMRKGYRNQDTVLEKYKLFHMLACQRNAMNKAGVNLVRRCCEKYPEARIRFAHFDHHLCHAASACFASPFQQAACLIADSFGEKGSLAFYRYADGGLHRLHEPKGLESLGFFYMKLTELCAFDWLQGEEWKVMGLAAYGQVDEELLALFTPMLRVDGLTLRQNRDAIRRGLQRIAQGSWPREAIACTGQYYFSTLMTALITEFHRRYPQQNLVLGGGCALNSSFNGIVTANTPFRNLFVPSAPADDGTALGAAWLAWRGGHAGERPPGGRALTPYLGSELEEESVQRFLRFSGLPHRRLTDSGLFEASAELLSQGKLLAWVQGRAEFGPRALGNRSILADARNPGMKDIINGKVKFREEFRPLAPAILHEHGPDYFEHYQPSPYMERTLRFKPQALAEVPAAVHSDGTGRLQSVTRDSNPRFYGLLEAFYRRTGVPLLLNTSLNVMGKPIVHSVEDVAGVFTTSGLDALAIGNYLLEKPQ